MGNSTYDRFVQHVQKISDLYYATAILHWDKEVNLPPKGAGLRSRQIATLEGMGHQLFTSSETLDYINQLKTDFSNLDERQQKNVSLLHKDYDRQVKFDKDFVIRRSKAISAAYHAWLQARKANDFKVFEAPLAELVALKQEQAEIMGYKDHPYDALLDEFE
ncbi:MAG: carboxypeptidase M32, partial [Bacteroidota bacterium]